MTEYTINMIQDEMTADGSHWWDRETLRFFNCRVSDKVYQGDGGVYFVTSEKYDREDRLYSVRKYDPPGDYRQHNCSNCQNFWRSPVVLSATSPALSGEKSEQCPKCNSRNIVSHPVKTIGSSIDTIGNFNSLTRSQAHREAKKLAGPEVVIAQEIHNEMSDVEQFVVDIQRGGGRASTVSATFLVRLATKHHYLMEEDCNYGNVHDENGEPVEELAVLMGKIVKAAKDCHCGVRFSGDPRGSTVKLILPNGNTNDLGKDGWCVPTC